MKRLYTIILTLTVLFLPSGYAQDKPLYHIDLENVKNSKTTLPLSAITDELIYIPLETTENSLINIIFDILLLKNHMVILDAGRVLLFDREGNFIRQIGSEGQGPGEYLYLNNIIQDLTSDEKLYLTDPWKIIHYDIQGNHLQTTKFPEPKSNSKKIMMTPDLFVFCSKEYHSPDHTKEQTIAEIVDINANIRKKFPDHSPLILPPSAKFTSVLTNKLYACKNSIRLNPHGLDTLFTVTADKITPYAIVSLGKMKASHNLDFSRIKSHAEIVKLNQQNEQKLSIGNIQEDDHFLYIHLFWGLTNQDGIYCIYDKKNRKVVHANAAKPNNDLDGGISFFPKIIQRDGVQISWLSAEKFKEQITANQQKTEKVNKKLLELADTLVEDDNPVIILIPPTR